MSFKNGCLATVWKVTPSEKYSDVQITTVRKRQDTGVYETDFSGFVRFIGQAHLDLQNMPIRYTMNPETHVREAIATKNPETGKVVPIARLRLEDVACTKSWSKEYNREFVGYQVYGFTNAEDERKGAPPQQYAQNNGFMPVPDDIEGLPFS